MCFSDLSLNYVVYYVLSFVLALGQTRCYSIFMIDHSNSQLHYPQCRSYVPPQTHIISAQDGLNLPYYFHIMKLFISVVDNFSDNFSRRQLIYRNIITSQEERSLRSQTVSGHRYVITFLNDDRVGKYQK